MRIFSPVRLTLLACTWALALHAVAAQSGPAATDTLNRLDDLGRKQGWWQIAGPVPGKPDYRAGIMYEEGRYVDSRRTGTWKRYWPNGKPRSEVNYVKGLAKGAYATFYPDGRPEEQGSWDLDRNTGTFKRWYANGHLMQEFIFDAHGTRNGQQKYYHENGRLQVEVGIVDGKEEGTLKRYYPNGDLQEQVEFHAGEADGKSLRTFKPTGPVATAPVPAEATPAPAKRAEEQPNAADFRAEGWNTLYDGQHRLAQQGLYRKGRLWEGKVYKYDRNGLLYRIEVYDQGRFVGKAPIGEEDR
ncbi:MAG: toxin-antitoxin system YwqK family antitoxin [Flavobacteriales bacterium]|nr:toxin-antitoxin system YwqK family antitoxin [Flavobacteriales bacterium]